MLHSRERERKREDVESTPDWVPLPTEGPLSHYTRVFAFTLED